MPAPQSFVEKRWPLSVLLVAVLGQSVHASEPQLVGPRNLLRTSAEEVAAPQATGSLFHKPIGAVRTQIATSETDSVREQLKIPSPELQSVELNERRAIEIRETNWEAPATCHRPLYFEEINLERYGYSHCGCLQPVASAAHFFGTVPLLPYKMTLHPAHECLYTLGHYRPGNCVPYRINQLPLRLEPAAVEAFVLTSAILLIP